MTTFNRKYLGITITQRQVDAFETRSGTNAKGPYVSHSQLCYINLGGDFPQEVKLRVPTSTPYPAGFYTLDPSSFACGDYKRLEVQDMKIIPDSAPVK